MPESNSGNVLAGIRRLGRAGYDVTQTVDLRTFYLATFACSRFATFLNVPDIHEDGTWPEFIEHCHDEEFDALLPFGHVKTAFVSLHRDEIGIPTCTPPYDTFHFGHDKGLTMTCAHAIDVPYPRTWYSYEWEEVDVFPVVVKARKSCGVDSGIRYAFHEGELESAIRDLEVQPCMGEISDYKKPIIQEYIAGDIYDVVGLYQNGVPKVAIAQRRIETIPLEGGPGVWNITVREPELIEQSCALLDYFEWHGPYQTEWMKDPRDGKFKLIELNPKMWGTMELAIRAGIDIPVLAAQVAMGEEIPQYVEPFPGTEAYEVGVQKFWPLNNIMNFRRDPSFRRFAMGVCLPDLYDLTDPFPSLYDLGATVKRCLTS